MPGVRLEQKGPIIALHTREASGENAIWSRFQVLRAASEFIDGGSMRIYRGSEVFELLPIVGMSRGNAVIAVQLCLERRLHGPVFTVYIGEDVADDDVRRAIGECGIAAVLGASQGRVRCHLTSHDEIDAYIRDQI